MKNRSQLQLHYYDGWGGKSMDSQSYNSLFKDYKAHDFGMVDAQLFASSDRYHENKFTAMTLASGNVEYIHNDIYTWTLPGDSRFKARVVAFLESGNANPGRGNTTFRAAFDRPWFAEPDLIQSENNRYGPIRVVGNPQPVGDHWHYTLELQSTDPNAWIDPSELQLDKTFVRVGSMIPNEMNNKRSGITTGSSMDLQCQIGAFGGEIEVTDRTVRMELNARQTNNRSQLDGIDKSQRMGSGYEFEVRDQKNRKLKRGYFISDAESILREQVNKDRELMMEFGELSNRTDAISGYKTRSGPGFRPMVKDSYVHGHNGSLTLRELEDLFHAYVINKLPHTNRNIVISTGSGGWRMFHDMVNDEASGNSFLMVDNDRFIQSTTSGMHKNALRYGYQFTEYWSTNGVEITLVYDPIKDDPYYCQRMHPQRNQYTVDSFRFDIYDFGSDSKDAGKSNMCMVMEANAQYYAVSNTLVDFATGPVNDGSTVANFNKGGKIMFEDTGSLWIKDISRCMSIVYEPDY